MGDLVFVLLVLTHPVILLGRGQTISMVIKRMLVCGVISGITVQTLDLIGVDLNQGFISGVGTAVLTLFTLIEIRAIPEVRSVKDRGPMLFFLPSVFLGILVVITRITAHGQDSHSLSNINFVGSEDNAKWLNVLSQLLSGDHVVVGNVGGICVSFLSGIVSLSRTFFPLLTLSTNQVSLVIDCLIVAQLLLVLALPAMLIMAYRPDLTFRDQMTALPLHTVVAMFLMSASTKFMTAGHLSAQLVLVFGTAAAIHFVSTEQELERDSSDNKFTGLVLVLGVTASWLPLQLLSAVPSAVLGVSCVRDVLVRGLSIRQVHRLGVSVILMIGGLLVARNTFIYVTSDKSTITNLLSASGATPVHTTMVICLALVSVVLSAVFASHSDGHTITHSVRLVMIISLVLTAFVMADYLKTGTSNYGTQKMIYLTLTIVIGSLLIPGLLGVLSRISSDLRTTLLLAVASALTLGLAADGSLLPWLSLTKQSQWHSTASVAESPWARFTLPGKENSMSIATMPIACAIKKAGTTVPAVDWTTYACTRFLTSMAGLEASAGPLVEWQLRNDWVKSKAYLLDLPEVILNRELILIDESSKFVGLAPIKTILED